MAEKRVSATTMNILYNTPSSGINIYTTYDINLLTGTYSGDVISSSSITSDRLSLTFNENNTSQTRPGYLTIKKGSKIVGLLTVSQSGNTEPGPTEKYFKWENEETGITITHDYTSGEELTAYDTNYTQGEYGFLPTTTSVMKNPALLYHNNNFSFSFDENSGTTQRQETINIVRTSDSGVLATLTFIQEQAFLQ